MTPGSGSPDRSGKGPAQVSQWRSPKIQPWHLDRLAIVYVRQSTPQQVAENRESTLRQYALAERAVELGWPADRVIVIDDDQAKSGTTIEGRLGFQRLLAEVGLDHVGLILGIELSRLARSCRDWHQLIELCAVFRTLLTDPDGIYDPTDYNDRLLLGLTGIMSEAELHVIRNRMRQGLLNKVRRGEVFLEPPIGYVPSPHGGYELDPDEQVRAVVRMVFDQFERLGTARKVVHSMIQNDIDIGVRLYKSSGGGQLEWRRPARSTINKMLKHPIYAGYYCYGRHQANPRRPNQGRRWPGRVTVPPEEYLALIPDVCPAYITRDQFEANQRRLAENRALTESKGAPREGPSLLAGLIICGRCGRRMAVQYSGRSKSLRYTCRNNYDSRIVCNYGFVGRVLDQLVVDHVLAALQPGALELSLAAAEDVIRERATLDQNWRQRVERAKVAASRVERQYQAAEPENRLVARTLERRWEEALQEVRRLEEEYARFQQVQPTTLTRAETDQIHALARDLPTLWGAPTTTPIDRQQIVRFLIARVEVSVEGNSDQLRVTITWTGGQQTHHQVSRPVKHYEQLADFDRLLTRVKELRAAGQTREAIAACLNAEGYHPPYGVEQFNVSVVSRFVVRYITRGGPRATSTRFVLGRDEWFVNDLANRLEIGRTTLHRWIQDGWVEHRQLPGYRAPFVCWADKTELRRLTELARTPHHWYDPPLPSRLTTPRPHPSHKINDSRPHA